MSLLGGLLWMLLVLLSIWTHQYDVGVVMMIYYPKLTFQSLFGEARFRGGTNGNGKAEMRTNAILEFGPVRSGPGV
jgi:hypothetical protein